MSHTFLHIYGCIFEKCSVLINSYKLNGNARMSQLPVKLCDISLLKFYEI